MIGDGRCVVEDMLYNQVFCEPPKSEPSGTKIGGAMKVTVSCKSVNIIFQSIITSARIYPMVKCINHSIGGLKNMKGHKIIMQGMDLGLGVVKKS